MELSEYNDHFPAILKGEHRAFHAVLSSIKPRRRRALLAEIRAAERDRELLRYDISEQETGLLYIRTENLWERGESFDTEDTVYLDHKRLRGYIRSSPRSKSISIVQNQPLLSLTMGAGLVQTKILSSQTNRESTQY